MSDTPHETRMSSSTIFGLFFTELTFQDYFSETMLPFDICSGVSVGHVSEGPVQKYWL